MGSQASELPETMTAYRFKPLHGEPVREVIPVPSLAPDDVLVKIVAAGVCHSDLGVLDQRNPMNKLMSTSFTLGHEGAGETWLGGLDARTCLTEHCWN